SELSLTSAAPPWRASICTSPVTTRQAPLTIFGSALSASALKRFLAIGERSPRSRQPIVLPEITAGTGEAVVAIAGDETISASSAPVSLRIEFPVLFPQT